MQSMNNRTAVWITLVFLLLLLPGGGVQGQVGDGIDLAVGLVPGAGDVALDWIGAQQLFEVFRSADPATVNNGANRLGVTPSPFWLDDMAPEAGIVFYKVTERVNQPPILDPIGSQSAPPAQTLSLTVSASDPDGDPVVLGVGPLPLPAGAAFDALAGVFTFRLAAAQASDEDRDAFVAERDVVAAEMTRDQVAEAERIAREWKPAAQP